ncbi:cupin domain-containing protein [Dyadobacter sp. CY107]|uniref:cupin domain-containing protein n=1 Tax=Dyadobacter fanqingshengii TaxID=2906443 RepID=UPI001F46934C|nr:cupin domain-containing protein [Dyadobacter fanqingshengii]MCF2506101.1 cupin domain-containing protein [Dyadobacter fanqingshengii]
MKNAENNDAASFRLTSPLILEPGQGETLTGGDASCVFKVTSDVSADRLGVFEITLEPHTMGATMHYHRFIDETFIVIQGILTVQSLDKVYALREGSVAYVPRLSPHGFSNTSDMPVKLMLVFNPAKNREAFFRSLYQIRKAAGPDANEAMLRLLSEHDSHSVE